MNDYPDPNNPNFNWFQPGTWLQMYLNSPYVTGQGLPSREGTPNAAVLPQPEPSMGSAVAARIPQQATEEGKTVEELIWGINQALLDGDVTTVTTNILALAKGMQNGSIVKGTVQFSLASNLVNGMSAYVAETAKNFKKTGGGGMEPYQAGQLAVSQGQLELNKQQEARTLRENIAKLQLDQAQLMTNEANSRTSTINQLGPWSLPAGTEYVPGFEPGGPMESSYKQLGLNYTPWKANTIPVDTQNPIPQAYKDNLAEAIRNLSRGS